jgi:hypothetical protein
MQNRFNPLIPLIKASFANLTLNYSSNKKEEREEGRGREGVRERRGTIL